MNREMMVHVTPFEVHVAILENDELVEYYVERKKDRGIVGNIYKGKVGKVLPGMQSAFVDIGIEKNAFLYVTDFFEEHAELKETLEVEDEGGRPVKPSAKPALPPPEPPEGEPAEAPAAEGETPEPEAAAPSFGPAEEPVPSPEAIAAEAAATEAPAEPKKARRSRRGGKRTRRRREAAGAAGTPESAQAGPSESAPEVGEASGSFEPMPLPPVDIDFLSPGETFQPEPVPAEAFPSEPSSAPPAETFHAEPPPPTPAETLQPEPSAPAPEPKPEPEERRADDDTFSAGFYFRPDEPEFSAERSSHGRGSGRRRHRKGYTTAAESDPGNIASMLKNNQEIIVQVMKEPMALKSARITSHISIPGRMLVYLPTVNHIGVSRKIRTDQERKRLRTILHTHRKDRTGGFIVRTASDGCAEADLVQDMEYAFKTWQDIQKRSTEEKAPCILLEELDLVERMLRDKLDESFQNIWVDDEAEFATIVSFVDRFMPKLLPRVKLYNKDADIFEFFNLTPEVQKATRQKVWLKSGGFIVINHTEALIAVDVNTGKYVGKGSNFEETITKVNSDAAKEIARQIRLRNLGGIIVIDFIDMQDKKGKRQVMDLFQQELRRDKAPSKILTFNEFGLVILTRKRTASALEKNLSETCVACGGSGFTRSASTVCYEIYSTVSRMRSTLSGRTLTVRAHPEVIRALKGEEKEVVDALQGHFGLVVALVPDPMLPVQTFDILSE